MQKVINWRDQFFYWLLISPPPKKKKYFPCASRVERILLTSMCWTVYFVFLKCWETEHSSVNKYEATGRRPLPSSEGKQMCSNEHSSRASLCTFSIFQILIFKWDTQGNVLRNKLVLQCFAYWNCYGRSEGCKHYIVNVLNKNMSINIIILNHKSSTYL